MLTVEELVIHSLYHKLVLVNVKKQPGYGSHQGSAQGSAGNGGGDTAGGADKPNLGAAGLGFLVMGAMSPRLKKAYGITRNPRMGVQSLAIETSNPLDSTSSESDPGHVTVKQTLRTTLDTGTLQLILAATGSSDPQQNSLPLWCFNQPADQQEEECSSIEGQTDQYSASSLVNVLPSSVDMTNCDQFSIVRLEDKRYPRRKAVVFLQTTESNASPLQTARELLSAAEENQALPANESKQLTACDDNTRVEQKKVSDLYPSPVLQTGDMSVFHQQKSQDNHIPTCNGGGEKGETDSAIWHMVKSSCTSNLGQKCRPNSQNSHPDLDDNTAEEQTESDVEENTHDEIVKTKMQGEYRVFTVDEGYIDVTTKSNGDIAQILADRDSVEQLQAPIHIISAHITPVATATKPAAHIHFSIENSETESESISSISDIHYDMQESISNSLCASPVKNSSFNSSTGDEFHPGKMEPGSPITFLPDVSVSSPVSSPEVSSRYFPGNEGLSTMSNIPTNCNIPDGFAHHNVLKSQPLSCDSSPGPATLLTPDHVRPSVLVTQPSMNFDSDDKSSASGYSPESSPPIYSDHQQKEHNQPTVIPQASSKHSPDTDHTLPSSTILRSSSPFSLTADGSNFARRATTSAPVSADTTATPPGCSHGYSPSHWTRQRPRPSYSCHSSAQSSPRSVSPTSPSGPGICGVLQPTSRVISYRDPAAGDSMSMCSQDGSYTDLSDGDDASVYDMSVSQEIPAFYQYSDWMGQLPSRLLDLPITQIAIPGSHISLAIDRDLRTDMDFSRSNYEMASFLRRLPDLTIFNNFRGLMKRIWRAWMPKQMLGVYQQLEAGVRFLDLHVTKYRGALYGEHGLYSRQLKPYLKEIKSFLDKHPKEIVLLHFPSLGQLSNSDKRKLVTSLFQLFGARLARSCKPYEVSLNRLYRNKKQVIVLFPENEIENLRNHIFFGLVWSDEYVEAPVAQKQTVPELAAYLEMNEGLAPIADHKHQLHITKAVLCPDMSMVFGDFQFKSMRELCENETADVIGKWVERQKHLNIVLLDYVGLGDVVGKVLRVNDPSIFKKETVI